MTFSITGCIAGILLAVVFYLVATALVVFAHSTVVFGLIALLIAFVCATRGVGVTR